MRRYSKRIQMSDVDTMREAVEALNKLVAAQQETWRQVVEGIGSLAENFQQSRDWLADVERADEPVLARLPRLSEEATLEENARAYFEADFTDEELDDELPPF